MFLYVRSHRLLLMINFHSYNYHNEFLKHELLDH